MGSSTQVDQGRRKNAAPSETKGKCGVGCFALEVGMQLGGVARWIPIGGLRERILHGWLNASSKNCPAWVSLALNSLDPDLPNAHWFDTTKNPV
jgi:hypothetical protein